MGLDLEGPGVQVVTGAEAVRGVHADARDVQGEGLHGLSDLDEQVLGGVQDIGLATVHVGDGERNHVVDAFLDERVVTQGDGGHRGGRGSLLDGDEFVVDHEGVARDGGVVRLVHGVVTDDGQAVIGDMDLDVLLGDACQGDGEVVGDRNLVRQDLVLGNRRGVGSGDDGDLLAIVEMVGLLGARCEAKGRGGKE